MTVNENVLVASHNGNEIGWLAITNDKSVLQRDILMVNLHFYCIAVVSTTIFEVPFSV